MSDIYHGMLMVPVQVKADGPSEGLALLQAEATRLAGMIRPDGITWRDTYKDTQASIGTWPIVSDVKDNVVSIRVHKDGGTIVPSVNVNYSKSFADKR